MLYWKNKISPVNYSPTKLVIMPTKFPVLIMFLTKLLLEIGLTAGLMLSYRTSLFLEHRSFVLARINKSIATSNKFTKCWATSFSELSYVFFQIEMLMMSLSWLSEFSFRNLFVSESNSPQRVLNEENRPFLTHLIHHTVNCIKYIVVR